MDFSSILKMLGSSGDDQNSNLKNSMKQTLDRMKMKENPELAGPQLPETTPDDQKFIDDTSMTVAGSIGGPAKGMRLAADTAEEVAKRGLLNGAVGAGEAMPSIVQKQQALSRAADFADRARQQKFDRIKKILGR